MKKLLFILLFIFLSASSFSQRLPLHSIFSENLMLANPALCGSSENNRIWIDHRNQWLGFNKDSNEFIGQAPITNAIAIDLSFENKFINGFGAYYLNDKLGYNQINALSLLYSKRFDIKEDVSLRLGFSADYYHLSINGKWLMIQPEPLFETYCGDNFDLGLGFLFQFKNWEIGSGLQHIIHEDVVYDTIYRTQFATTSTSFLSYKHEFGKYSYFSPILLVKMDKAKVMTEIDLKFSFEDRFFLSLGLRPMSAILISSGFRLFISIDLLLAYELNITAMHNYSNGTYGVLLRYNF